MGWTKMPYKNKKMKNLYMKAWNEKNKEDIYWKNSLWRINNPERKNELDRLSWAKHKNYYNWLRKFKHKLKNLSD